MMRYPGRVTYLQQRNILYDRGPSFFPRYASSSVEQILSPKRLPQLRTDTSAEFNHHGFVGDTPTVENTSCSSKQKSANHQTSLSLAIRFSAAAVLTR